MMSFWLLGLLACGTKSGDTSAAPGEPGSEGVDADGDGFDASVDCDDNDQALNLNDGDGDGFSSCDGDCDDADANTFPGSAESESSTDCMTDADGDGYGSASPAGTATAGQDVDDSNPDLWFLPSEGSWLLSDVQNIVNNCDFGGGDDNIQSEGSLSLAISDNTNFTITFESSTDSIPCTLNVQDFTCIFPDENGEIEINEINETLDYRISTTLTGSFSSSATFSSSFDLSAECTDVSGPFFNCDIASDYLPCTATWDMTGTKN